MNRRKFLKSMGAASASVFIPSSLNLTSLYKHANAAVNYAGATIAPPTVMPQVINIFLYGGPSELAGNLTNIVDIDANSQNSYESAFQGITTTTTVDPVDGLITPNNFWRGAGGDEMEFLLGEGYMNVYRTLMKRKDGTRSHRESILMSLKGSLDIETSAGVGTRMAALLYQHGAAYQGVPLADGTTISGIENLLLPFVSFESDSRIYAPDPDVSIPLLLRGTTLDDDFDNPFTRNSNAISATLANDCMVDTTITNTNGCVMDTLVNKVNAAAEQARWSGVVDAFALREFLEGKIASLDAANNATLPTLSGNDLTENGGVATFDYPDNSFGRTVRAAVTLAIENPSTLFLSLGGALGGWDDHNNGVDRYPGRMANVMQTLRAAMWHIKYSNGTTPGGNPRTTTDNIIINVFGDFGRRVNLNGSQGWDHGNNQNLFTLGGAGVVSAGNTGGAAARTLGKLVGTTVRVGDSGTNNQFTNPVPGSYEFEPMSVAASLYSYMGVQNPNTITADPEMNPTGDPAIDENAT